MIECESDLQRFILENTEGDWIIHIIPIFNGVHPVSTFPSIIFIKNISSGKIYYYAFNHPDSNPNSKVKELFEKFIKNHPNKKWVVDKKTTYQLFPMLNLMDVNLWMFFKNSKILELYEYETSAHKLVSRNTPAGESINKIIPLMKHLEFFNNLCEDISTVISDFILDDGFKIMNDIIIPTLGEMEHTGIYVDKEKFNARFKSFPNTLGLVYSQYNIYTNTGRPSNRYGGVNYAALNSKDKSRECFISRFGENGKVVVIDYSAFHPRIICKLINYNIPINVNIYEYLAKLYFGKQNIDDIDIREAKNITFRQLYGEIENKYHHIKYLANLKQYIDEQWLFFIKNGYVLTPFFKRKITSEHIQDPNPSKVFNYILQAAEGEIAIPKIKEIQEYLVGRKTKAILYTYDAVIYDFHKDDEFKTLNEIRRIMSYNGTYDMKTYIGSSYNDVKQISF
jgi:hypothetical protein